ILLNCKHPVRILRTIAVLAFIILGLALVLPWFLLWSLLTRNPDSMYWAAMRAASVAAKLAGIRVHVEGVENIPPGVCIFAANHASNVDPLAFIPAIPRRVALLVKRELFRIPFLSSGMRLAHFVPVDRSDREAAAASVDTAIRRLRQGLSFAIFAEGTRSPDGRLRPFKKGAFVMGIMAGVPIVPVSIAGTQRLQPKGSWTIHPGEVTVRFGPPVDASSYSMDRRGELLAAIESLVAAGLPPNQQPMPSEASISG
ncbi:MAG TPA: lysophospholipid acyltransferase family protein, partial [Candidatus Acidoferrales bacterium]|nr:lysophospholipid acyltransferase family protein [Candidatus Acidoferrales bacterium]